MHKIPKGKLLIIGGAEDKGQTAEAEIARRNKEYEHFEILRELLPKHSRTKGIEIFTTASREPESIVQMYTAAFKDVGFKNVGFINIGSNLEASNEEYIRRVKAAHAVLFSGGDQFRLSTILGNTDVMDVIYDRYVNDKDFIVAGTSAGAMAATVLMLYEGENNEAMLKGTVRVSSGLGLLDNCIVDTHFVKRGRFGRLAQAIIMNPSCIGIGLGEDTALIIRKGNQAECRGSGMVLILDGRDVGHTNIAYADDDAPLCVENLRVHILCKGNGFLLKERAFVASKKDIQMEKKFVIKKKKRKKKQLDNI